jgi:hypothetical protein
MNAFVRLDPSKLVTACMITAYTKEWTHLGPPFEGN